MRRKREHNLEKKRGGCETENKEVVLELVGAELGIGYNWLEEGSIYIQFCFGKEGERTSKNTHTQTLSFLDPLCSPEEESDTHENSHFSSLAKNKQNTHTLSGWTDQSISRVLSLVKQEDEHWKSFLCPSQQEFQN